MAQENNTRPPSQTAMPELSHPSRGGRPYDQHLREAALVAREQGQAENYDFLRQQHRWPSRSTERRWANQLVQHGHVRPMQRSGNNRASVLKGYDLIYLAMYRGAFSKASAAEINAYLYRANYGNPEFRFYSPSQIIRAQNLSQRSH